MKASRLLFVMFAMMVLLVPCRPALADETDDLRRLRESTISLINALVDQGLLTRSKADELIAKAGGPVAPGGPAQAAAPAAVANASAAPAAGTTGAASADGSGVIEVPYIPEAVKDQIRDEVKSDVLAQAKTERWGEPGAFPDWLQHFTWFGDIRLRAEADRFPTDNTPNAPVAVLQAFGVNIANSTEANNRLRVRARFGFEATVGDTVTVGMGLATGGVGAGSNPGTENQTLGNYESRSTVGFDRAYLNWHPEPWLSFIGGRIGDPFFRPTTLIWANDVSLEGLAVLLKPNLSDTWRPFLTAGLFPILQNDPSPTSSAHSKWLYAYQSGLTFKWDDQLSWTGGATLYDYRNIQGIPNPSIYSTAYNGTAAPFRQTGNTVFDIDGLLNTQNGTQNYLFGLASKFDELNISSSLDIDFLGPVHAILNADWVSNLGFKQQEILERTGYRLDKQTTGWQTQLTVGEPALKDKHSWQAWIGYRYVQRDATLDAFTDQDFHLGGTDAKGYYLGAGYAFEKNTAVWLRWYSAKQIDGVELAGADSTLSGLPLAVDVLQVDVTARF
jgi:hypothetical protein